MSLWLDVTSCWNWRTQPVGITRCEVEVARGLSTRSTDVRFCRFLHRFGPIVEVSHRELSGRLFDRARSMPADQSVSPPGVAARGLRKLRRLFGLSAQEPFTHPFRAGDTYLSLGMDAWDKDLTRLEDIKRTLGIRVIMTCHDLIPIRFPQLVNAAEREVIPEHTRRTARLADTIICNSDDTMSDLARFIDDEELPCRSLARIRLGADLIGAPASSGTAPIGVQPAFILYVSSLGPRKNHEVLYRAYQRMRRGPAPTIPQMVWAGKPSTEATSLLQNVQLDPLVRSHIVHLANASDDELHWLYRQCAFTVFSSLAEGWGLPVAESTAYGKLCVASDLPAVREVASDLHMYVDPQSAEDWERALTSLFTNPARLESRTRAIVDANWSRTWEQTVDDVLQVCAR